MPAICLNSSPERWCEPPRPPEAKVSLPGLALAAVMMSFTDLKGESGRTIRISGPFSIRQIGVSLAGSKLSFSNMLGLTASGAKLPMPIV